MDYEVGWWVFTLLVGGVLGMFMLGFMKRVNEWYYVSGFNYEKKNSLPPGDMGWPFIGKMWDFYRAFKAGGNPDSFISVLDKRFGSTNIYKTSIFGNPTILVSDVETCKRVLTDCDNFGPGWPKTVHTLMGKKGFHAISVEEHKRLRKLTASSISGQVALSLYISYIEHMARNFFEKLSGLNKPVEFLLEMRKVGFSIIMHIIMSGEIDAKLLERVENEYDFLTNGLKSMAINLPGFAYHKALKARKELLKIFGGVVEERRAMRKSRTQKVEKDMLDLLMDSENEDGTRLSDEEIIDLIIIYLLAGHESSAHVTTWAMIFLYENPTVLQKAREEQEELKKARPSSQTGLNLDEIRNMKYLSKVIDESLRMANLSFALFREAKADVIVNGYRIPKGWKVLAWIRNIHVNSSVYPNPHEFNPSRWDDPTSRSPGTFVPFGEGPRTCPGATLAKLELSIFLHHFLLNYEIERVNPRSGVKYLPLPKPKDNCLARIKKLSVSSP